MSFIKKGAEEVVKSEFIETLEKEILGVLYEKPFGNILPEKIGDDEFFLLIDKIKEAIHVATDSVVFCLSIGNEKEKENVDRSEG